MAFTPGSVHKAVATFSNPKTAGFDYIASLCMGAGWTEMARASFHLDAGQSKAVEFPVTMPTTPGTYPVYFKVSSSGALIATFAAEAIVIVYDPFYMDPAYPYAPGYLCGGIVPSPPSVELGAGPVPVGTSVTFTLWVSRSRLDAGVIGAQNPVYVFISGGGGQWQSPNYTVPPLPAGANNGPSVGITMAVGPVMYDTFFTVQVYESVTNKRVQTPAPDSGGFTYRVY